MTDLFGVLSAFGLSAPAGLNAYLPLFIIAALSRFTGLVKLQPPFDALGNEWVIGVLALLVFIETVADKIPGVDTVNDLINTVVRPTAGAILFASTSNVVSDVHPVLALVCGLLVAGGVHALKATARPVVTAMTGGIGNPIISIIEDALAVFSTLAAILAPVVVLLVALALVAFAVVVIRSRVRTRYSTAS